MIVLMVVVVVVMVAMAAVAARAFSARAAIVVPTTLTATLTATQRMSGLVRFGVESAAWITGRARRRRWWRRGGSGLEGAFSLKLAWAVPAGVAAAIAPGREIWAPLVYLLGPSQSRHVGSRGMQAEG